MEISGKGSLIPKKEILGGKKKELALPLDIVHLDESVKIFCGHLATNPRTVHTWMIHG